MQCALLKDGVVFSIVTASTEEEVQSLASKHESVIGLDGLDPMPEIGWKLEGNVLVPGPGQSAVPSMKLTKLAFRNRLTTQELLTLYGMLNENTMLRIIQDNLNVATYVDLTRPDTQAAVGYLMQLGILTVPRMQAILGTPPTEIEKYKGPL
jgi:hypothetical protein